MDSDDHKKKVICISDWRKWIPKLSFESPRLHCRRRISRSWVNTKKWLLKSLSSTRSHPKRFQISQSNLNKCKTVSWNRFERSQTFCQILGTASSGSRGLWLKAAQESTKTDFDDDKIIALFRSQRGKNAEEVERKENGMRAVLRSEVKKMETQSDIVLWNRQSKSLGILVLNFFWIDFKLKLL